MGDQSSERMQGNLYPDIDTPTRFASTANYSLNHFPEYFKLFFVFQR